MNIVCIDTSFSSVAITAQGNAGTFTSVFTPAKARHSAVLIPAIEAAVKQAGFSINETFNSFNLYFIDLFSNKLLFTFSIKLLYLLGCVLKLKIYFILNVFQFYKLQ